MTVVVPALNEADTIRGAIGSAQSSHGVEVIVADGGSADGTARIARECGATVVVSAPGRSLQMNTAVAVANGQIVLFLHADTRLPDRYDQAARETLHGRGIVAGAFRLSIDGRRMSLRLTESMANLRSRWLQMPYGDQAIFMKTDTFRRLGGFPDLPVMEDYELVRRLKRQGRVAICRQAVTTSARRWTDQGVWWTTLNHQMMIAAYRLGLPPHWIAARRRPARGREAAAID